MKKILCIILSIMLLTAVACTPKESSSESENDIKRIGLSQIVEHPSLDQIREGIYKAIEDGGFELDKDVTINYLNSQGSIENANTIANEFNKQNYDVVIGITTPSTQALFNKIETTPIVYSGVTDPKSAGLVGDNITGVSDMTPIKKQLTLLKELLPQAKNIGMVYNSSELNSEIQIGLAKEIGRQLGLNIITKAVTASNEIGLALDSIMDDVDVLYTHKDNTIASAYPLIVNKANKANVPIIGAVKDYVDQGALATDGPSEFEIGYQTGKMVVRILNGEAPSDIPAEVADISTRSYNAEAFDKYNLKIPK